MIITEYRISLFFSAYNYDYFNGELPTPKFKVIHKKDTLGTCWCSWLSRKDAVISVTDKYILTEEQFRNILVHEMIHFYLAYTRKDMFCRHGKAFLEMMNDFNNRYGLNIQTFADLDEYEPAEEKGILGKIKDFLF